MQTPNGHPACPLQVCLVTYLASILFAHVPMLILIYSGALRAARRAMHATPRPALTSFALTSLRSACAVSLDQMTTAIRIMTQ